MLLFSNKHLVSFAYLQSVKIRFQYFNIAFKIRKPVDFYTHCTDFLYFADSDSDKKSTCYQKTKLIWYDMIRFHLIYLSLAENTTESPLVATLKSSVKAGDRCIATIVYTETQNVSRSGWDSEEQRLWRQLELEYSDGTGGYQVFTNIYGPTDLKYTISRNTRSLAQNNYASNKSIVKSKVQEYWSIRECDAIWLIASRKMEICVLTRHWSMFK